MRRQGNVINRQPTLNFVYLGDAVSKSADLDTEIERLVGAAWANVRRYSS